MARRLEVAQGRMNETEVSIPDLRGTLSTNYSNRFRLWCSWPGWDSYTLLGLKTIHLPNGVIDSSRHGSNLGEVVFFLG